MDDVLKPCPFCGGEAEIIDPDDIISVQCKSCQCGTNCYCDERSAIAKWNTRTPDLAALLDDPATLEAIVEEWALNAGVSTNLINPREAKAAIDVIKKVAGV